MAQTDEGFSLYPERSIGDGPARGAFPITPGTAFPAATPRCRGVWVGTAGNLSVTFVDGSTATLTNVPVGVVPVALSAVATSGTTATGLVGLL